MTQPEEIVKRLRMAARVAFNHGLLTDAANTIEELERERDELAVAFERIKEVGPTVPLAIFEAAEQRTKELEETATLAAEQFEKKATTCEAGGMLAEAGALRSCANNIRERLAALSPAPEEGEA